MLGSPGMGQRVAPSVLFQDIRVRPGRGPAGRSWQAGVEPRGIVLSKEVPSDSGEEPHKDWDGAGRLS